MSILKVPALDIGEAVMTKEEWLASVECGCFIPDDGFGYWGTETHQFPRHSCFTRAPEGATHVHWFNK